MKNVVRLQDFRLEQREGLCEKPNVFAEKITGSVPTIPFVAEGLGIFTAD